jgi:hypothetical protein
MGNKHLRQMIAKNEKREKEKKLPDRYLSTVIKVLVVLRIYVNALKFK